jgi:hypothetical protein
VGGRGTGGGAAVPRVAWRAGRAPARGKLERWRGRATTRGEGEDGGGRRCPRTEYCAGDRGNQEQGRGAVAQGGRRGKELNQGLLCNFREKPGPY